MNTRHFQTIAAALLEKHYGLGLADTTLHDDTVVAECMKEGQRPYQAVAEHAREADLGRIDLPFAYGEPSKAEITSTDEAAVIRQQMAPRRRSPCFGMG